jgi:hypothetical protein
MVQYVGLRNQYRRGEAEYQLKPNGTLVGRRHDHGEPFKAERLIPVR